MFVHPRFMVGLTPIVTIDLFLHYNWWPSGVSLVFRKSGFSKRSFVTSLTRQKPVEQGNGLLNPHLFGGWFLVGGWTNPFETYESKWESSPGRGENKKYLKPPPSFWVWKHVSYEKNPDLLSIEYWLVKNGILLLAYKKPHILGSIIPYTTETTRGPFFIAHVVSL